MAETAHLSNISSVKETTIEALQPSEKKKILYVVLDGMSDGLRNVLKSLGNKTPLQAANIPNFDKLTKMGMIGLLNLIKEGHAPESDEAILDILGYLPPEYPGRGIIEVLGLKRQGITLPNGGVALRVNFATGREDDDGGLTIFDRRAGRNLTSEEAAQLSKMINKRITLSNDAEFQFVHTVEHRGILILSVPGKTLCPMVSNTDPGYVRQAHSMASKALAEGAFEYKVQKVTPTTDYESDEMAMLTAQLINEFTEKCYKVLDESTINKERTQKTVENLKKEEIRIALKDLIKRGISLATIKDLLVDNNPDLGREENAKRLKELAIGIYVPPANLVIGRNASGKIDSFKTLREKFGLNAAAIVQMPVEEGVAYLTGMHPIIIPPTSARPSLNELQENYAMFLDAIIKNLLNFDMLYSHLKGPDIPGHDGDEVEKIRIIEAIDKYFIGPLLEKINLSDTMIVILEDHSTSTLKSGHTGDPVPVAVIGEGFIQDF